MINGFWRLSNRKFLRLYNPATTSNSEVLLYRYSGVSNHESNISTYLEYCNSPNNVGDHSNDTTIDEPILSHIEEQCVIVPATI